MEMMRQIFGAASLACRQRKLENCFFDHLVRHFRMQNVPQKLHSLHKPRPWKAEARVIAYVYLPPLHRRYGPKVWNAAQNLHLHHINKQWSEHQKHSFVSFLYMINTYSLNSMYKVQHKPPKTFGYPRDKTRESTSEDYINFQHMLSSFSLYISYLQTLVQE